MKKLIICVLASILLNVNPTLLAATASEMLLDIKELIQANKNELNIENQKLIDIDIEIGELEAIKPTDAKALKVWYNIMRLAENLRYDVEFKISSLEEIKVLIINVCNKFILETKEPHECKY